jgi:hypothetical protein
LKIGVQTFIISFPAKLEDLRKFVNSCSKIQATRISLSKDCVESFTACGLWNADLYTEKNETIWIGGFGGVGAAFQPRLLKCKTAHRGWKAAPTK